MLRDRRVLLVVLAAALVGVPAAVLGTLCVGNACRRAERPTSEVPFCSLPPPTRTALAGGFREDRSPDVLAVTGAPVAGGTDQPGAPWPSVTLGDAGTVPLVFAGAGVDPAAEVPEGTTLDAVAPTIAEIAGLRRPHPGVRSGEAVEGVAAGAGPRLVVQVVWKGVDAAALERDPTRWPVLRGLLEDGAGTMAAEADSQPLDPAAVMATVGTGGLPRDHGITGTYVRDEDGRAVRAWSEGAPFSVIAGLGDDLDELLGQRPRVGLVGTDVGDRGLVGGTWYIEHDADDVVLSADPERQVRAVSRLLSTGYGTDEVPDLLAVAMSGTVRELDEALGRVLEAAQRASGGSVAITVTSTGAMGPTRALPGTEVEAEVERRLGAAVVEAVGIGGLFLDQEALAAAGLSDDRVAGTLRALRDPGGRPLFADVFPSLAVTFARYCT